MTRKVPWPLGSHFGNMKTMRSFDCRSNVRAPTRRKGSHKVYYLHIPEIRGGVGREVVGNEPGEGSSLAPGPQQGESRQQGSKHLLLIRWFGLGSLIFMGATLSGYLVLFFKDVVIYFREKERVSSGVRGRGRRRDNIKQTPR